jgi:PucR C-terminal helix-turn-helix domain
MSHSTSLAIVSGAVAGDGLERLARSASEALGHPVAVICPSADGPALWPAEAVPPARLDELTAAAKAIVRLMGDGFDDPQDVVEALVSGPPADLDALVAQARRLGIDLARGAIAVCGLGGTEVVEVVESGDALVAPAGPGRVIGLVSLSDGSEREAGALALRLRAAGWLAGVSAPRRRAGLLHEAVREAMLLAELASVPGIVVAGQEETYRLLIGVLLRDPAELEQLRASSISPLLAYDAEHATDLLVTLETFLAHHGSTTETAEAMQLHRHTVGYRLSRVQEVSGLSPYESDGRERLSLGLKAAQILAAWERLSQTGIGSRLPTP